MEHAALAGTLASATSLTPSIEDGEFRYGWLFTVKFTEDGLQHDWVCDVSPALGATWQGILTAEKLTGVINDEARQIAHFFKMVDLRTRLDGAVCGPYLIKTQEPMLPGDLETYLNALSPEDRKATLKRAKI